LYKNFPETYSHNDDKTSEISHYFSQIKIGQVNTPKQINGPTPTLKLGVIVDFTDYNLQPKSLSN